MAFWNRRKKKARTRREDSSADSVNVFWRLNPYIAPDVWPDTNSGTVWDSGSPEPSCPTTDTPSESYTSSYSGDSGGYDVGGSDGGGGGCE